MKNVIVNIVRVMLIVVMIIFTVIGIVALQEPEWNFVSTVVPMTCILVIQCCCYWFPWNQPQKQQQQPQQKEWEVDKCDGCCRTKLVHTGYGLCEGCIYGCDPEPETAPESWRGKIANVRFIKVDGTPRYMRDFIILHISRYKSGKVLVHGLEPTDNGWQPKGFCIHQLVDLRVVDNATENEMTEAYAVYRQLSNPNQ